MNILLVLAIAVPFIGSSLNIGYGCVINSPQAVIRDWIQATLVDRYGLHMTVGQEVMLWAIIVAIFQVGAIIGVVPGTALADRIGRRWAFFFNHILVLIGSILIMICKSVHLVEFFVLGRFILGIAAGIADSLVPVYLTEVVPPIYGGVLGVVHTVGIFSGIVISQIVSMDVLLGTAELWPYLGAATAGFAIFAMSLHPFLTESPSFIFFIQKDGERGRNILSRLRKDKDLIEEEAIKMEKEAKGLELNQKEEQNYSIRNVLATKDLRMPLFMVLLLFSTHQLSGINGCLFYSNIIFTTAGLSQRYSEIASICGTTLGTLMYLASIPMMNNFGRRPLLLSSIGGCIICLISLIVSLKLIPIYEAASYTSMVSFLFIYICWTFGLGSVPYVTTCELIPAQPRPAIMSLGIAASRSSSLLVGICHPIIQNAIGEYSLLFSVGVCLFAGIFFFFKLPETYCKKH
ncbi:unnamed protein product, partial [Meganyctiphanes norvegica]